MARMTRPSSNQRQQYIALAVLSLGAAAATGILWPSRGDYFRPYFGSINPLLAIVLVIVAGFVSLGFLQSRGWFEIYAKKKAGKGLAFAATVATLLAIPVILVDLTLGFPRDLNVPAPQSLLFYPAMALVAEIVFHAVPLGVLLTALGPISRKLNPERMVWFCILPVAVLEPGFQLGAVFSGKPLAWLDAYVGLHVFVINVLQLYVFRRYDFVSMISFRLVYYVHWHIVWGYLRLQLLF